MRKVSLKRQKQLTAYGEVCKIVDERDKTCICDRWSSVPCYYPDGKADHDHIVSRGRGGDLLDPNNIQLLCRADHALKDLYPYYASVLGLNGGERQALERFKFCQHPNSLDDWHQHMRNIREQWDNKKRIYLGRTL